MIRSGLARRSFAAMTFAVSAFALTSSGCGGCQQKPEMPKSVNPPTILSPQNGDTLPLNFFVDGTYDTSGVVVTVAVSGVCSGTKTDTSKPTWSTSFSSITSGDCTAKATVPNSTEATVSFHVVVNPVLEVEDPDVTPIPPPPAGAAATATNNRKVKAKVKYTGGGTPTITIQMIRSDGKTYPWQAAQQQGMSPQWTSEFPSVESGYYAIQAKVEVNGTTTTTSRMKQIN